MSTHSQMKDHTFSVPCMIITDFVMEARPFFESQIKRKDSTWYLLSKILVLQQSAVSSSLVGEFSLCHTGGRLCSQVDLLCCSECAPNFCLGGNVNGFCLSYPLHLQSWPELAFLMKKSAEI